MLGRVGRKGFKGNLEEIVGRKVIGGLLWERGGERVLKGGEYGMLG